MNDRRTVACGAACVLVALALSINASADPDLGFHVATGRAVLASGGIPSTNVLSFAEPTHPWIDQQWLPATIFAVAFDRAGFAGTLAIRALLVALTAAFVFASARRLGASDGWASAFAILGTWAAALRFVERPLLFSNLALAVVVWGCASAWRARANGRSAARFVGVAALAAALAAHLHAGAVFSFFALAAAAVGCALDPIAARAASRAPAASARDALVLLAALVLALLLAAATLALYHPFGAEVLAFPFRMAADPYLAEHLSEFRPPWAQPLRTFAPYWVFLAATLVAVLAAARRTPMPFVAVATLGIAVSLRHARFVDLAWIGAAPVAAAAATLAWPRVRPPALAGLAVVLVLGASVDRLSLAPPAVGGAPAVWPAPVFDAIEHDHLVGPAFVQDGWAGPFLARFWPRERVFFHPAFEAYSTEHYRLYQSIRYGEPGWREALDRFGVQLVVMRYTSDRERALQSGAPNLRQRLASDRAWALVYADDLGEIFVRREGTNAAVAARSPDGVDPDRLAFDGPPRRARAQLENVVSRAPSDRLHAMLAVARADAGDAAGAEAALSAIRDPALAALARRAIGRLGS